MKHWFLTLKFNRDPKEILAEHYISLICWIMENNKQICIVDNAFETDAEGRLHFHCIIATRYIRWQKFTDYTKGMSLHINNVELKDPQDVKAVQKYLQKQKLNPFTYDQKAITKQIESEYSFI